MNSIGFRLPQHDRVLLEQHDRVLVNTRKLTLHVVRCCAWLLLCAFGFQSAAQTATPQPETPAEKTPSVNTDVEQTAEEDLVYSLLDYKRNPEADRKYVDDYAGEDGVQRSLEGPDVVITAGKKRTVYEYRQNGQLRLVKIIPRIGRPYYLVPADQTRGFGDLGQADMLLPQWTIIEF